MPPVIAIVRAAVAFATFIPARMMPRSLPQKCSFFCFSFETFRSLFRPENAPFGDRGEESPVKIDASRDIYFFSACQTVLCVIGRGVGVLASALASHEHGQRLLCEYTRALFMCSCRFGQNNRRLLPSSMKGQNSGPRELIDLVNELLFAGKNCADEALAFRSDLVDGRIGGWVDLGDEVSVGFDGRVQTCDDSRSLRPSRLRVHTRGLVV
jgi:hypothetical protein